MNSPAIDLSFFCIALSYQYKYGISNLLVSRHTDMSPLLSILKEQMSKMA